MDERANRGWIRPFLAGTTLLVGMIAAGCGDDVTPAGTGGGGAGPQVETFGASDCGVCFEESCITEIDTCLTDPGCASYLSCLRTCPVDEKSFIDPACDQACSPQASSEATRVQAELMECRLWGPGASCAECGIPSKPFDGPPPQQCEPPAEPAPTACRQCYWEKCCDTWNACYASGVNPDCDALGTCITMCTGPTVEPCVDACLDAHPNSVDTLFDQVACAAEQCAWDADNCNPAERDACEACLYGTCGSAWVELLSDPEGFLLFMCLGDCGSQDAGVTCVEGCFDAHPTAESAGYLWTECVAYQCDATC